MNKFTTLAFSAFLVAQTQVQAENLFPPGAPIGLCTDSFGQLTRAIMEARQSGTTLERALEIANENEALSKATTIVVLDAYEQPKYESPSVIHKVVVEFGNKWVMQCIKELSD
jgi:hypothetical protein